MQSQAAGGQPTFWRSSPSTMHRAPSNQGISGLPWLHAPGLLPCSPVASRMAHRRQPLQPSGEASASRLEGCVKDAGLMIVKGLVRAVLNRPVAPSHDCCYTCPRVKWYSLYCRGPLQKSSTRAEMQHVWQTLHYHNVCDNLLLSLDLSHTF